MPDQSDSNAEAGDPQSDLGASDQAVSLERAANEIDRSARRERLKQRIFTGDGIDRSEDVLASSRPSR
jgi:hypothetical protein